MQLPNNIDSKFRYILICAKRARQLQSGVRPLVQTQTKKATKIAQMEVSAGLIPFEIIELKADSGNE
ncbi:MAG TPA: DNA-directed RNA polymerase subunit omega [Terriglobia bacterium]|nr:DNA-directed RNA polymerase subunit omega [Terriglobia bacterium]